MRALSSDGFSTSSTSLQARSTDTLKRGISWLPLQPHTIFGCTSYVTYTSCVIFAPYYTTELIVRHIVGGNETHDRPLGESKGAHIGTADVAHLPRSWSSAPSPLHAVRYRGTLATLTQAINRSSLHHGITIPHFCESPSLTGPGPPFT